MLKTPDSIIDWCTSYLVILMVGCAGSAFITFLCGILRGLGDSISALIYSVAATVINIVLILHSFPSSTWALPELHTRP